jgi:DNA polymerase-3 subunit delta
VSFRVPDSASELDPVYVLASTEGLLMDRALAQITDLAVPESLRAFNLDVLDAAAGASAQRIAAAAATLPMMGERRMVLVRSFDSLAAAELANLLAYLEAPSGSTVLVCVCTKVDKRIKFFAAAKKRGYLHELAAPKKVEPWIRDEASRLNLQLAAGVDKRLAEVIGSDLTRLGLVLEQLDLYAGGRAIEVDDVEELVAQTRERTVFELTDAVSARDGARALEAVAALFDQRQSSIGVLMMLARHMRQVALCQQGLRERLGQGELARKVGAPPFVVSRLSAQARSYSTRGLAEALSTLAEADRALKGFDQSTRVLGRSLAERVVVERVVTRLIELARPS